MNTNIIVKHMTNIHTMGVAHLPFLFRCVSYVSKKNLKVNIMAHYQYSFNP